MNYFICFKLSHSDLLVVFLGAFPWFSNELSLFAYKYKKGASRCIYHSEAQQSLYTINAKGLLLIQQTEIHRKTIYLRERLPCPRVSEIC